MQPSSLPVFTLEANIKNNALRNLRDQLSHLLRRMTLRKKMRMIHLQIGMLFQLRRRRGVNQAGKWYTLVRCYWILIPSRRVV
jgi:hypothetical protein